MKYNYLHFLLAVAVMLHACNGNGSGSDATGVVDVGGTVGNLTEITTSLLGKSIRFVPLETGDSSLVNNDWTVYATDDRVVIANIGTFSYAGMNADVLVFDIDTGRFVSKLGRIGSGPEDYLFAYPVIDRQGRNAYFGAGNGKGWVRYDLDGQFIGKILPDEDSQRMSVVHINDTIMYNRTDINDDDLRRVVITRRGFSGAVIDSVVMFDGQRKMPVSMIFDGPVSFKSHNAPFRNTRRNILEVVTDHSSIVFPHTVVSMIGSDGLHFEELACDTIYNVTADGYEASVIFDMGPDGFPLEELNRRPIGVSELLVTNVMETPLTVLFSVSRGLPADDNSNTYIGVYDRLSGSTVMGAGTDGIRDDLGGFMPFNPVTVTPSGKFVGVLTMEAVDEWMDEHPDAILPETLKNYDPEGNPVLVIID